MWTRTKPRQVLVNVESNSAVFFLIPTINFDPGMNTSAAGANEGCYRQRQAGPQRKLEPHWKFVAFQEEKSERSNIFIGMRALRPVTPRSFNRIRSDPAAGITLRCLVIAEIAQPIIALQSLSRATRIGFLFSVLLCLEGEIGYDIDVVVWFI